MYVYIYTHTDTNNNKKEKLYSGKKKLRVNTVVAQKVNSQHVQCHRKNPVTIMEDTIFLDLPPGTVLP